MIELGAVVKDSVSGFEGMVLAKLTSLHEAPQVRVHPTLTDDNGKIRESVWFEETRVQVVTPSKHPAGFATGRL